jgi:NAD(P)-dependent dehydrogenase (short-subunit alcohol dehydrogenase family)
MRLENKVALITGGGTGIGEAIALKFAREGASIMVAGRSRTVDDTAQSIIAVGGTARILQGRSRGRETGVGLRRGDYRSLRQA